MYHFLRKFIAIASSVALNFFILNSSILPIYAQNNDAPGQLKKEIEAPITETETTEDSNPDQSEQQGEITSEADEASDVSAGEIDQDAAENTETVQDGEQKIIANATCNGLPATITDGNGSTTIQGTSGDDVIVAGNGADTIYGNGGNDTICAGNGADQVFTDEGNDWIDGENGEDTINAGEGDNTVYGDHGADEIWSGEGDDHVDGGQGEDSCDASGGDNFVLNCEEDNTGGETEEGEGSITIHKYVCNEDTVLTRDENGPDASGEYTVPEGCAAEEGVSFGYTYQADVEDGSGPYIGISDEVDFTALSGATDGSGMLSAHNLSSTGRYNVAELDADGERITEDDLLALYCWGDTGGGEDNYDLTFVPDGGTTHCVAYNNGGDLYGDEDRDDDGVNDDQDNCPDISNPNQEDADDDDMGDACEDDTSDDGSLMIHKYSCPEDIDLSRDENGPDEDGNFTVPANCDPEARVSFGYTHQAEKEDGSGPFAGLDDDTEFMEFEGSTDAAGILTVDGLSSTGRINVTELEDNGVRTSDEEVLQFYCYGDQGTSDDNYDITFIPEGGTSHCVVYNLDEEDDDGDIEDQCEDVLVSDPSDDIEETGTNSMATYDGHPSWTANIPGATWIWKSALVENPTDAETYTFVEKFHVDGVVSSAILDIAADNSYRVWVNGVLVGADADEDNYHDELKDQYDVMSALHQGTNEMKIEVKNWSGNPDPELNPAGLLFRLTINDGETEDTGRMCPGNSSGGGGTEEDEGKIMFHKYTCDEDTALSRDENGPDANGEFDVPESCEPEADVHFGYTYQADHEDAAAPYPGSSDEVDFTIISGSTDEHGELLSASLPEAGRYNIAELDGEGDRIAQDDLLALYCWGDTGGGDDNYDITFIPNGGTTHCVAYNNGGGDLYGEDDELIFKKYACPEDTDLSRDENGPDASGEYTVPEGCEAQEGISFGFVPQDKALSGTASSADVKKFDGTTDETGTLALSDTTLKGEYGIVETDTEGDLIDPEQLLALFCETDEGNGMDNMELADINSEDTTYCVAYNRLDGEEEGAELMIHKYACDGDTVLSRDENGPDASGDYTVPESCAAEEGVSFGYTYQADKEDNSAPYPGSTDEVDFTALSGTTNSSGVLSAHNLNTTGRYNIAELDAEGDRVTGDDLLALYCWGDTGGGDDNYEISFLSEDDTVHCVAYNNGDGELYGEGQGDLMIHKYVCDPEVQVGAGNIPDQNGEFTVPEGCEEASGWNFGSTYQADEVDYSSPYPGSTDEMDFTAFPGATASDGTLLVEDLHSTGRYNIAELDTNGDRIAADQMLGVYCSGDTGTSGDNYGSVFVPENGTAYCAVYNIDPDCELTVVSDASNTVDGQAAVAGYVHPGWTASIPGATWIWKTANVEHPDQEETYTFTKTFTWNGPVTSAMLDIAADNSYNVSLNGNPVASDANENNFQAETQDSYDLGAEIDQGLNTLTITVTNGAAETTDPQANPAGLLYKLSILGDCDGSDNGEGEGEQQGQLLCTINLNGAQEVPSNASTATGTAQFWNDDDGTVGLHVTHNVANVSGAHIHSGAPGIPGPITTDLGTATSPIHYRLTDAEYTASITGDHYINVHSTAYPDGEIRGQVNCLPLPIEGTVTSNRSGGGGGGGGSRSVANRLRDGDLFSDDFSDEDQDDALDELEDRGVLTSGDPERDLDRAEAATMMVRLLELGLLSSEEEPFPDVHFGEWYTDYIQTAKDAGIVMGYGTGLFLPEWHVKMSEALAILSRAKGITPTEAGDMPCTDLISYAWYTPIYKAVDQAGMLKVFDVDGQDLCMPDKFITRGEFAQLAVKFFGMDADDFEADANEDESIDDDTESNLDWLMLQDNEQNTNENFDAAEIIRF